MKEVYYDYLQSEPRSKKTSFGMLGVTFEDVMNLPISYLKLQGTLKELFVDKPFYVNRQLKKMHTLGDLVNIGYDTAENYIQKSLKTGVKRTLYNLELALAKFSLKLKGSEFTVFEIDVEDVGLTKNAVDWAIDNGFYELGDFYIYANEKFDEMLDNKQNREIKKSVLSAMKRFGILSEGKDVRIVGKDDISKTSNGKIIKTIFPDILQAIEKEKEIKKTNIIGLDIFDNANYTETECDYSKLIALIKFNFKTATDFMLATILCKRTFDKIIEGKVLADRTLKKICGYFKVPISDIVEYKTTTIKTDNRTKNVGVGTEYDFSKLFIRIRKLYGGRSAFREVTGISDSSMDALAKGKLLSNKNMRRVCKALRCKLEDIMVVIPQVDEAQQEEKVNIYYDYSKFKKMLKERKLSMAKLLDGSGLYRNYIGLLVNSGKPLNEEYIKVITAILNCNEDDLYEIKTGKNPYVECDYSKLKALLDKKMISANKLCKNIGIESQELFNKMSAGKHLGQEKIDKIVNYLGCKEEDIITIIKSREEVKENRRKSLKKLDPEADYSKLFEKLKNEGMTLDELCKKLQLPEGRQGFKRRVNRMLLPYNSHITKLCRYFKCQPEDLYSVCKKVENDNLQQQEKDVTIVQSKTSKKAGEQGICDYTELLNIVVQRYKNLKEFTAKADIHRDYVTRINRGQLLDYKIYKKILDTLHKPLDEIVKFKNTEDRDKILKKIEKIEYNKNNPEVDYSLLYKKLSEKNLTVEDLYRKNIVSLNIVLYKIKEGKEISTDTVQRICKYLECESTDIMKRIKPKKPDPKIKNTRVPEVDYSYLISLVDKRFLNLTQICRDVGIGIHFAHCIKKGERIGKDKLQKICAYLGFEPEDIVFEISKEDDEVQKPKKTSFVNSSYGGGTARVKPAFRESKVEDTVSEQKIDIIEMANENSGGSVQGKTPRDTKFYFTSKGYIKNPNIKFSRYKFSANIEMSDDDFGLYL